MNCCNCICPQNDPCRGATGPTGPAGPMSSSLIADFYNLNTGLIANGGNIPVFENINLDSADISHSFFSADITLQTTGYYLITYDADATRRTDGTVGLAVKANGTNLPLSTSTAYTTANNLTHLSSSFIFNNTDIGTVLNIANSDDLAIFYNLNLVIQRIS